MISSAHKSPYQITDMHTLITIIVPADGLAPLCAKTSAVNKENQNLKGKVAYQAPACRCPGDPFINIE